jgi:hypothetical protein
MPLIFGGEKIYFAKKVFPFQNIKSNTRNAQCRLHENANIDFINVALIEVDAFNFL